MKIQLAIITAAIFATSLVLGQTSKPKTATVSVAPEQFLGKTYEECQKILGKPTETNDPKDGKGPFERIYKSPVAGISKIKLERVPDGYKGGIVPTTINFIWYYFPEATSKDAAEALLGLASPSKGNWTTSAESLPMPPKYSHAGFNSLSFQTH